MSDKYPSMSPYVYCAGNPVRCVDLEGMWGVEIGDDGNSIQFIVEEGDDINSLSVQLGVSKEELQSYEGLSFETGQTYSFKEIQKIMNTSKNSTPHD